MINRIFHSLIFCALLAACQPVAPTVPILPVITPSTTLAPTATLAQPTAIVPSVQPTQPLPPLVELGPDQDTFPSGVNPLTGLAVENPTSLQLPAVLVSISNSPITARPQAGLSFAPYVVEMFIGEGTSRFLAAFYGDLPRRFPMEKSKCKDDLSVRQDYKTWLGNRVWFDENINGQQDPWETGIGGVPLEMFTADGATFLAATCTDSNGYYAFDASKLTPGDGYLLKVDYPHPATTANTGFETNDSDLANPDGWIAFLYEGQTNDRVDIGFTEHGGKLPIASSDIAPGRTYVGPIRSGRLTYDDFNQLFPSSCLVFASAGDGILERLEACQIIYGASTESPNTALLDVDQMKELAAGNKVSNIPINYSGNLFSEVAPANGQPASVLLNFFHQFAQSQWQYDQVSGRYLRFTDDIDASGKFHPDTDRLTGRPIGFENVIVMFANYSVFRHGQYDVDLCCGLEGYAYLFRDGQVYKIRWSTNNGKWEQTSGLLRPIKFVGEDKLPIPLKPGKTFISLMTKNSSLTEASPGFWQAIFSMPDDVAPPK